MLVRAYVAPDEFTAITIREMLISVNINAMIRRFETSWLDGLAKMMKGGWGEVLVNEQDLEEAKTSIDEFLQSTTSNNSDSSPE
ncbi:hypothetical protein A2Y85_03285 [candidate division WOR-3 bacterium RBG_13_43_14]|uniref:DUF2007 domain-containing protein n=1 Tax=candidate division WOR-3 bacterium RBG_13_43_14 TaxID=1802590 RepID=A0A1F4UED3_UNCW3|nr:MAG: hypothetical protein A2Y85_03285 [candidate division WOR-3 bacterium RBG_13_43_14]